MLTITGWLLMSRLAISTASAKRAGDTMCTRALAAVDSGVEILTDGDVAGRAGAGCGAAATGPVWPEAGVTRMRPGVGWGAGSSSTSAGRGRPPTGAGRLS